MCDLDFDTDGAALNEGAAHRRVVQVDFTAAALPDGLDWRGV